MTTIIINNIEQAKKATLKAIDSSIWFSVDPRPYDQYEISVKPEALHLFAEFRQIKLERGVNLYNRVKNKMGYVLDASDTNSIAVKTVNGTIRWHISDCDVIDDE